MKKKVYIIACLIPFLFLAAMPVFADEKKKERGLGEESIYYIVIDRFNNGDTSNDFEADPTNPMAYHGGDIQGIIDELDYLKDMGFTSILLSPVFANEANTHEPFNLKNRQEVDEHYGSIDDFKQLVELTHKKDMKVILDLGIQLEKKPLDEAGIVESAKWWVQETDIDGFKLDLVPDLSTDFINNLTTSVEAEKEDFIFFGQPEKMTSQNVGEFESAGIDLFFHTDSYEGLTSYSVPDQSFSDVEKIWDQAFEEFANTSNFVKFIDNPSTVRFTYLATEENEHPAPRLKLALAYMYTTPGIPSVFYGTEIALNGGEPPTNLGFMNFRTDQEIVEYITLLAKVRSTVPALTEGTIELVLNKEGLLVFKREHEDQVTFVALNNTTETQSFTLSTEQVGEDKELIGLLTEDLIRPTEDTFHVVVKRDIAEVYLVQNSTSINYVLFISVFIIPILMIGFLYLNKKRHGKTKPE
ncbi:alpha-amylase family glycosyl hydrolase [Ferdinandcohnia sp. Marseille-Q9671]